MEESFISYLLPEENRTLLQLKLLPTNYVFNGICLTNRRNEDDCSNEDCLNPITSNEFVTSGRTITLIHPSGT